MSSRQQVQTACQRCRQRRAKCNGEQPCNRCEQRGEACEYNRRQWVSKSNLRAEIDRLKRILGDTQSQPAQDQSSNSMTNDSTRLQGWIDGVGSPTLEHGPHAPPIRGESMTFSAESMPGGVPLAASSMQLNESAAPPSSCFDQLLSWRFCHPTFEQRNAERSASGSSTSPEVPLPSAPLDAYATLAETDTWTETGWTRAHIRHLFDVLVTWDNVALCILGRNEFLQDYETGSLRFCSSALVHALLALSTRLLNEAEDDAHVLPSGWLGSNYFLQKTDALIRGQGSAQSLPDIQALGVLALYHLRCGREQQAKELAELCSTDIRSLCSRESGAGALGEQYFKVRATTYCGAISLVRMLHLTTGVLFNEEYNLHGDSFILDQLPYAGTGASAITPADTTTNLQHANHQLLIVKMFQLTEWVYKVIVENQKASPSIKEDILVTYTKCLGWYREVFELIGYVGSRSPFILFIHMYYHFCLLCAFRPFVGSDFSSSELQPHAMCVQAVQSIIALAQSYDDLFTLRRVSALIPYFVCASGLFSLAIEDSGSNMGFTHADPAGTISPQDLHVPHGPGPSFAGPETTSPQQIKVSSVTRARLLLSKMGASHPAAVMAEKKLNESLRTWKRCRRGRVKLTPTMVY